MLKMLWKNGAKVWLITSAALLAFILTVSIIATQVPFIANTMSLMTGGGLRKLVEGDPGKYQYYKPDYTSKEKTLEEADKFNETIAEEGFTLLKNESSLPLAFGAKVTVLGKNSVNLVYGGTGSSSMNSAGAATIHSSLRDAGFSVNPAAESFYKNNAKSGSGRPKAPAIGSILTSFVIGETPVADLAEIESSFSEYGDAALVVISRICGEGFDLPRTMKTSFDASAAPIAGARNMDDHYLQLDANEAALLKYAGSKFSNVIIIINASQSIELGFLDDPTHYAYHANVKGALWVGSPGKNGINALGRILNGKVNPSGRTVDTHARNFKADPSWQNFGNNLENEGNRLSSDGKKISAYSVEYEEGIYIGYRYHETRAYEEAKAEAAGGYIKKYDDKKFADWHNANVVFPFGYGLSYDTDFEWRIKSSEPAAGSELAENDTITIQVEVTNNGAKAGKDVVQMYYTAPYNAGGIEKSHVVLGDFAKTKEIAPGGGKDVVTLTLKVPDMASYDFLGVSGNNFKGYITEGGAYKIRIAKNAHDWNSCVIDYSVPAAGFKYDKDEASGTLIKNRFDEVSSHFKDKVTGKYRLLSRSDFEGTWPTAPTAEDRQVSKAFANSLKYSVNDKVGDPWYTDKKPEQPKRDLSYQKAAIKIYDLIKPFDESVWDPLSDRLTVPYGDGKWDELLNQLTVSQMADLIGIGSFNTGAIDNIAKPKTIDPDGPPGFTVFMNDPSVHGTCFYVSECVIGATWNKEIAFSMGKMIGNEGLWGYTNGDGRPYSGWYAPAVNMHRSQFGGRNWEYYSEDGYLSGTMGAQVVKGARTKGVYTYVKHFALNDQETDRDSNGLITWAEEQSIREIYLRPFEIIVKEGQTMAMMSSFNRIGTTWAGGSYELLTEVLRDEWGFKGMVITDYNVKAYMDTEQMIRAGGDLNLSQAKKPSLSNLTATQAACIRQAVKNILYTVANSNAMNGMGEGVVYRYTMPYWKIVLICVDCAIVAGLAVWGFFAVRKAYGRKRRVNGEDE